LGDGAVQHQRVGFTGSVLEDHLGSSVNIRAFKVFCVGLHKDTAKGLICRSHLDSACVISDDSSSLSHTQMRTGIIQESIADCRVGAIKSFDANQSSLSCPFLYTIEKKVV